MDESAAPENPWSGMNPHTRNTEKRSVGGTRLQTPDGAPIIAPKNVAAMCCFAAESTISLRHIVRQKTGTCIEIQ